MEFYLKPGNSSPAIYNETSDKTHVHFNSYLSLKKRTLSSFIVKNKYFFTIINSISKILFQNLSLPGNR